MGSEILTLQELSFEFIVEEFSRYIYVYGFTDDEYLKKQLRFLQAKYSQTIYEKLSRTGELKENHLEFLLNEYLEKVDVLSLMELARKQNSASGKSICSIQESDFGQTEDKTNKPNLEEMEKNSVSGKSICSIQESEFGQTEGKTDKPNLEKIEKNSVSGKSICSIQGSEFGQTEDKTDKPNLEEMEKNSASGESICSIQESEFGQTEDKTDKPNLEEMEKNSVSGKSICSIQESEFGQTEDKTDKPNLEEMEKKSNTEDLNTGNLFTSLDFWSSIEDQLTSFIDLIRVPPLDSTVKESILKKIISIGQSLTELSWLKREDPFDDDIDIQEGLLILKEIIPHMTGIKKLYCHRTCDDELLKTIASSCPQLTHLDISCSYSVSDEGLKALYINPDGSIRSENYLKYLDLYGLECSSITETAVIDLMRNVPSLEELDFFKLPNAIQELHKYNTDNKIAKKTFNLTSFVYNGCYTSEYLKLLTEICPNIRKLAVHVVKRSDLESCCLFPKLEEISISGSEEHLLNDLNIFFKIKGKFLKHLKMNNSKLSISAVIQNCPNLETLSFSEVMNQETDQLATNTLLQLHSLCWEHAKHLNFPEFSLVAILNSSPNIETLSLNLINCEEPYNFKELLIFFRRSKLKHLVIETVDACIKIDYLKEIILNCRSLRSITISVCPYIDHNEFNLLKGTIKALNRRIEILEKQSSNYNVFDVY